MGARESWENNPWPDTVPPFPAFKVRACLTVGCAKEADTLRSLLIFTVVVDEFASVTPSPIQRSKKYSADGMAEMEANAPCEKFPSPVTLPPVPANSVSEYWLGEKVAEIVRASVMFTVVEGEFRSATPSPVHPANE